jgi:large subunit ribosomal protein L9
MKVILNQTVPNVGKEGQVVTVAGGYARNYLFPRGLAIVADRAQLKALEIKRARVEAKLASTKSAAEGLKEKLDGLEIKIEGKVGRDAGKLFGAITAQDVADEISKLTGIKLEKKQVGVLEPIKRLGNYSIQIDLHRDVDATVKLSVFDPSAPVEVAAPEVEEELEPATV